MNSSTQPRADVYTRVTAKIIADLEQGVRTWQRPWNAEHAAGNIIRPLRATGEPYRGINVVLLWSEALDKGYTAPIWLTYKQAASVGAQVRKGEHGATVVYADKITKSETDDNGEQSERSIPFMKAYTVFNCEQIDGLPAHFTAKAESPHPVARIEHAEAFFAATDITIQHGGNKAFYSPSPATSCKFHRVRAFATLSRMRLQLLMKLFTHQPIRAGCTVNLASASAIMRTAPRN